MKRSLPPLNGLRAFEAAARHMSFTDAAEELSVTQAAISHQVRGLEQRLGLKLFVRRNRSLLLSEAGQAYLPSVRAAFDQLNEATEKLLQKDRGGHLTVTTTASFATKWLVPRLGGFQRANPEIDVRISTGTGLIDFSREDVDIGIRYGRGQWPGLVADRLVGEDVMPVCAPSLLKGPNPLRKPADLKRFTLLHIGSFPDDWQVWLTAAGIKGIEDKTALEPPFVGDAYVTDKLREIPKTLREATRALKTSSLLKAAFGESVIGHYVHTAEWEQFEYDRRVTDWELKRGFERS